MTAELNSQRVSYYTGVKLIRHQNGSTTSHPSGYYQRHHHQSSHPNHPHHYSPPHGSQHPPLHHPGQFHLPCPTGPPHVQHPGPLAKNWNLDQGPHGPPPHHPSTYHNGYNCGSNTTRLYTGSPLIRSSAYHTVGGGNAKRSFKQKPLSRSFNHGGNKNGNHHEHQSHSLSSSCSSGSSSSSSSNEHLNNIIHPPSNPSSPTDSSKSLDISPLKLSNSRLEEFAYQNGGSLSSPGSPRLIKSSSPSSPLSSSPNSADGNKDLDHFYFLDEHWKPSSDCLPTADMMLMGNGAPVNDSPSPPVWTSLMVDDIFAGRDDENLEGGIRDANNNIVGQSDLTELANRFLQGGSQHSFNGFSNPLSSSGDGGGGLGMGNFGATSDTKFGTVNSTVVNVETQIGTFNGQRDLEIRLCFIKGDRERVPPTGTVSSFGVDLNNNIVSSNDPLPLQRSHSGGKAIPVIGDPFCTNKMKFDQQKNAGEIHNVSE